MPALLIGDPALPLDEAGKYVAGAYIVFVVLLVVYVAIMAIKLQRIERELRDLAGFAEQGSPGTPGQGSPGTPGREAEDVPTIEEGEAVPGRGSEDQSISVSSGPSASGGGGV
ncbi:MAG TPA: hypothetical protein VH476_00830 [Solirubrobacterales bacterium]|jgi:hypothetical protein